MQNLQNWISQYLLDCRYQKNLVPKTLKAYRIDLEQFSALISHNDLELTREGLTEYVSDLHQRYKPRTVKRKIASVKAFCGYLEYENLVKENPFLRLRLKLNPPLILPRTIPLTEIEAILAAAYQETEKQKHLDNTSPSCGISPYWNFCLQREFGCLNFVHFNAGMYDWKKVRSKSMGKVRRNDLCRLLIRKF